MSLQVTSKTLKPSFSVGFKFVVPEFWIFADVVKIDFDSLLVQGVHLGVSSCLLSHLHARHGGRGGGGSRSARGYARAHTE